MIDRHFSLFFFFSYFFCFLYPPSSVLSFLVLQRQTQKPTKRCRDLAQDFLYIYTPLKVHKHHFRGVYIQLHASLYINNLYSFGLSHGAARRTIFSIVRAPDKFRMILRYCRRHGSTPPLLLAIYKMTRGLHLQTRLEIKRVLRVTPKDYIYTEVIQSSNKNNHTINMSVY